jgi:hypothetical protein
MKTALLALAFLAGTAASAQAASMTFRSSADFISATSGYTMNVEGFESYAKNDIFTNGSTVGDITYTKAR